jgi:hypothetical protein
MASSKGASCSASGGENGSGQGGAGPGTNEPKEVSFGSSAKNHYR